jgi:hypothetical protein
MGSTGPTGAYGISNYTLISNDNRIIQTSSNTATIVSNTVSSSVLYSDVYYGESGLGCILSFKVPVTGQRIIIGLTSVALPTIYTLIDFSFFINISSGNYQVYESGNARGSLQTHSITNVYTISFDGTNIKYYVDSGSGPILKYISLITSFNQNGYRLAIMTDGASSGSITNISFIPYGLGEYGKGNYTLVSNDNKIIQINSNTASIIATTNNNSLLYSKEFYGIGF